jgi:hypothetical protein
LLTSFYRVELLEAEVRLHYPFPERTVTLPRPQLAQAERVPSYKGLWYLRLRTSGGDTYESSLEKDEPVRESWERINEYLGGAGPP